MSSNNSIESALTKLDSTNQTPVLATPDQLPARSDEIPAPMGWHNPVISGFSAPAATPLTMRHIVQAISRYKGFILLVVVTALAVTAYGLSGTKSTYEATATLQIDPEPAQMALSQEQSMAPSRVDPDYFNTQLKVIVSPEIVRTTIRAYQWDQNPQFPVTGPTSVSSALIGHDQDPQAEAQSAPNQLVASAAASTPHQSEEQRPVSEALVKELSDHLRVAPVPRTRLIKVTYQHTDPVLAAQIANSVAETYIKNNLNFRIRTSKNKSEFLQKRLADLQVDINDAETGMIAYGKMNEIVSLEPTQNTVAERLIMLNRQLIEAEGARIQVESDVLTAKNTPPEMLPDIINHPGIQALRERLTTLNQKKAELLVEYTEDWPEVQQINQTIAQVQRDLTTTQKNILDSIQSRYTASKEREEKLRGEYSRQMGLALLQNEKAVNYRIRQEEINTKKELYKSLLTQAKEAEITASSEANNVSISSLATMPKDPVSPHVPLTLALVCIGSLVGASALAVARSQFDNRIITQEDIDQFVQMPTLGEIPRIDSFSPQTLSEKPIKVLTTGKSSVEAEEGKKELAPARVQHLVATATLNSLVGEAFRQFRTSLLLSVSTDYRNRVIQITSGVPTEGKTTTAVNTAISLAQTGARVVLLDCDLRKPSLNQLFSVRPEFGLSEYLTGLCQSAQIITETSINNLDVICGGPIPPNPTEVLGSFRMYNLLENLVNAYDYVIVDTPPLLMFADALILSRMVDSVVLVTRSNFSQRDLVRQATRRLQAVNARLLGVVLNDVPAKHKDYGYGYYYGSSSKPKATGLIKQATEALESLRNRTAA
ncbi:MAG TPA: polysaccharide biosynthesis tyrosine autokinase [Acidobacteriota bacterium]|nr:polysaccharide biosynthesis tyrosine autokinase [Acidobacteriota bacterium]